ncbi:hypothetical protein ACUHGC_06335 [Testudinibacter sp. P27/CKL/0425]
MRNLGLLLMWLFVASFASVAVELQTVSLPQPHLRITNAAFEPTVGLVVVTQNGELWQKQAQWQKISSDVATDSPLGLGYGKIAFTNGARQFQLLKHGNLLQSKIKISPQSGFVPLAFATIAVIEQNGNAHIARIESEPELRLSAVRDDFKVLPDLTPLAVALDGNSPQIAVLSQPTQEYAHGILGDDWEAKQIRYLERHDLRDLLTPLTLNALDVAEDNAPIAVNYRQGQAIATTLSNAQYGARAALIAAEQGALKIVAESDAIGQANRWLSLISDQVRLLSVVKPHLVGTLTDYDLRTPNLAQTQLAQGVSNHKIGTYQRDLSLLFGGKLLLPSDHFQRLKIWDLEQKRFARESIPFDDHIIKLIPLHQPHFLVLLRNGMLYQVSL